MLPLIEALRGVVEALDCLSIPYLVCGSLASSMHGVYRSTNDADVLAAISRVHVTSFAARLAPRYYADEEMMAEALSRGRMFNVILREGAYKVAVYPADIAFAWSELKRRIPLDLPSPDGPPLRVWVASAEDTLLSKLQRFRFGGEVSDRQWNDLRGILAVQRERLDLAYSRQWAKDLGVADLLERLLAEKLY